jgi:hypothetical protein
VRGEASLNKEVHMFSRNWFYLVIFVGIAAFLLGAPLWVDAKGNPGNPQSAGLIGPAASVHISIAQSGLDLVATVDGTCGSISFLGKTVNLGPDVLSNITGAGDFVKHGQDPFNLVWGIANSNAQDLFALLQACYNDFLNQIIAMQFQSVRNYSQSSTEVSLDAVLLRSVTR